MELFVHLRFCCVVWFLWEADGPVSVFQQQHIITNRKRTSQMRSQLILLDRSEIQSRSNVDLSLSLLLLVYFSGNIRGKTETFIKSPDRRAIKLSCEPQKETQICLKSWTCDFRRKRLVTLTHRELTEKTAPDAHQTHSDQDENYTVWTSFCI